MGELQTVEWGAMTTRNKALDKLRKKIKSPADLCKLLSPEAKAVEAQADKKDKKSVESLGTGLALCKIMLYGDEGQPPKPQEIEQLSEELIAHDTLALVLAVLAEVKFEARKDFVTVFNNVLRKEKSGKLITVDYIVGHQAILDLLIDGLDDQEVAFSCGMILRECLKYEEVGKIVLLGPRFYEFFGFVQCPQFDVASDAFLTLKELLTRHKQMVAAFLEANYEEFFEHYDRLLHSDNYVTKRQSLKLLRELLLDRANFNIMTRYISDKENLKLMMNLLRSNSKNIQYEAFHVFKVFVANPNKPEPILKILVKNRDRMVKFLVNFHNDRAKEDEQFAEEKQFLVQSVQALEMPGGG